MTDQNEEECQTLYPWPIGTKECDNCCGTGEPGPWEYDHHIFLRGAAIAVCGACRGAGRVGRFGFRLSASKIFHKRKNMMGMLKETDSHE